jgi:hypothetical protein
MARLSVLVLVLAALLAPAARADVLLPESGQVITGVTGSKSVDAFAGQVGNRPGAFGFFTYWYAPWEYIFRSAEAANARPVLHISTASNYGQPEKHSPREIAKGDGDRYLVALNARLDEYGKPAYVRLMAEMNQANNAYSAFNRDGSSRGRDHSTAAFRDAWRRSALILRGGPVAAMNSELAGLRLPAVRGVGADEVLPTPQVGLMWVPQTRGSPDIPANMPSAYWPGGEYVDWVGTDFYSRYPNFHWLEDFYRRYPGKPFVFGEWAMWGGDDPGFVKRLFGWIGSHPRVRMVIYNQGNNPGGPFRLSNFPRAKAELRRQLAGPRYR